MFGIFLIFLQRWIFWINLPFAAIGFVLIPLVLKLNHRTSNFMAQLRRVDWFGSFIFVASTTSFLIPITWGGVLYSWTSWRTLVPLILGASGLIGFVFWEAYGAREPLVRLSIFNNRTGVLGYATTFIHGMILWSLLYYAPLYFEAVKGYSPVVAGVALFPQTFTVAPASVAVGFAITATGRYRWSLWVGWFLTTLGMGLLYLLDVGTSIPAWIFLGLVSGLGLGILFPSMAFAIQAAASSEDIAFAVSFFAFFRAFGQSIGVAVGGSVFQNQMREKLLKFPLLADKAAEYSSDAASLVQIIKSMSHDDPQRLPLMHAYADSIKVVWAVMCGLAGLALLLSLGIKGLSLDVALATEQGFKHEEKVKDVEEEAVRSA
jgi:hypothetical protein